MVSQLGFGSWLPYSDHPRILSPMVNGFEEAKVVDLIDPYSRQWDLGLLQGLFNPLEADLTRSIPLCRLSCDDKLIWPYTSSSQYSVQLGYKFLAKENFTNSANASPNPHGGIWKLVWSLSILNKVKNFLRRSCRRALPVKENLKKREILMPGTYDHCNEDLENLVHALWDCPELFHMECLPRIQVSPASRSVNDSKAPAAGPEQRKKSGKLAMLLWTIWFCRNHIRVNNTDLQHHRLP